MASTDYKTNNLTGGYWSWLILLVVGWLFGYVTAAAVKDVMHSSRRTQVEDRVWSRIDAINERLANAERSLADMQGRSPLTYPPADWLEDSFRPLVERVREIEETTCSPE